MSSVCCEGGVRGRRRRVAARGGERYDVWCSRASTRRGGECIAEAIGSNGGARAFAGDDGGEAGDDDEHWQQQTRNTVLYSGRSM